MKNIKIKHTLLAVLLMSSMVLSSCFEEDNFLDDNLTLTGNFFPVVADLDVDTKSSYIINEIISDIFISYWTEGTLKQINVYNTPSGGVRELVSSTPHVPNFIDSLRTDVLVFDYAIPDVEPRTSVNVEVEVENENGFTKSKSFDISLDVILSGDSSVYQEGATATFDYTYWSGTTIDAVDLVQYTSVDTTVVFTVPSQTAFTGGFVLDTYQFNQVVPAQILPDSTITFEVQLINNSQADTIKTAFSFAVNK